ncbi:MAG: ferrochelatase [Chlamydiota bacterium]
MICYLLVNFGGPRNKPEIASFLEELLCDRDVIRTRFPTFIHNWFFGRVARKRAIKMEGEYEFIGGKSPIYEDTEALAKILTERLDAPVLTFHRYLPATHKDALQKIEASGAKEIRVLPLFPQFCYATTGSIARFFSKNLKMSTSLKLRWIQSYAAATPFVKSYQMRIANFLKAHSLNEEETILLFSAHGVPKTFIETGDIYESECIRSYKEVMKAFPKTLGKLAYQSKFGKGAWLQPYTNEVCEQILQWHEGRMHLVFIPISFTSDHIETLFEMERQYLPIIAAKGLKAYRCPALNLEPYWIDALIELFQEKNLCSNQTLIRNK